MKTPSYEGSAATANAVRLTLAVPGRLWRRAEVRSDHARMPSEPRAGRQGTVGPVPGIKSSPIHPSDILCGFDESALMRWRSGSAG